VDQGLACVLGSRAHRPVRERWLTVAVDSLHQGLPVPVPPVYSMGAGAVRTDGVAETAELMVHTPRLRYQAAAIHGSATLDPGFPGHPGGGASVFSIEARTGTSLRHQHACPHTPLFFVCIKGLSALLEATPFQRNRGRAWRHLGWRQPRPFQAACEPVRVPGGVNLSG
jgi:hypothetical protein